MNDLPIFVITLPEAKQRQNMLRERLDGFGLSFNFFDAVDGRYFDVLNHPLYNSQKRLKSFHQDLNGGELGCLLSHRSLYEKICNERIPKALILEDDVIFHDDFGRVLPLCAEYIPEYDLIRFLGGPKVARLKQKIRDNIDQTYTINRLYSSPGGAHAYLISQKGARILLNHTRQNWLPIDTLMGQTWRTDLNCGVVQPGLAWHDENKPSFIGRERFEKTLSQRTRYECLSFYLTRGAYKFHDAVRRNLYYYCSK